METDIQEKKQKESQNQARNGKDKVEEFAPGSTRDTEDAIIVHEIEAAHYEIKHGCSLLSPEQAVLSDIDKELMLFLSLRGAARIWLEKEPPSINSKHG
ncbi:hypothetical protein Tco_0214429 [Tanacetum coccineum]